MATANYNEITHCNTTIDNIDPMFHWDTHFPERYSRHGAGPNLTPEASPGRSSRQRRGRSRCDNRYKTQPITFDEIQEVDEEGALPVLQQLVDASKEGLKSQFTAFSRSMDGLVPGFPFSKQTKALSESKKMETTVASRVPDAATTPSTDEQTPEHEDTVTGAAAPGAATNDNDKSDVKLSALPASLQSRDNDKRRRKLRRSQRRNKSIEEIPESTALEHQEEQKPAG